MTVRHKARHVPDRYDQSEIFIGTNIHRNILTKQSAVGNIIENRLHSVFACLKSDVAFLRRGTDVPASPLNGEVC